MTDHERSLIFQIASGDPELFPLIHQIHEGFKRGTALLETCKRHGIIGPSFKQLWKDNGGSKVRVGSYLLKKLNRDNRRKLHVKDLI